MAGTDFPTYEVLSYIKTEAPPAKPASQMLTDNSAQTKEQPQVTSSSTGFKPRDYRSDRFSAVARFTPPQPTKTLPSSVQPTQVTPEQIESLRKYVDNQLTKVQVAIDSINEVVSALNGIFDSSYNWNAKQYFLAGIDVSGGDITNTTGAINASHATGGTVWGKANVGSDGFLYAPAAYLDVLALDNSLTLPTGTKGDIRYDTTTNKHYGHNGAGWQAMY